MDSHSAIEYLDKKIKAEEFNLKGNFIECELDISDSYEQIKKLCEILKIEPKELNEAPKEEENIQEKSSSVETKEESVTKGIT